MAQKIEVELSELRQITSWLAAVDIEFVEISKPGTVVRLSMQQDPDIEEARACPSSAARRQPTAARGPVLGAQKQTMQVSASSVGVFLAAHPARSSPLAAVGVHVRRGDIVGLLQIAQLCVPVLAPADGVVTQLFAPHGANVGYGTPLLELAPSS